jgi:hypothetical protein
VVISVDGASAAEVDRFTLRTGDGQVLDFKVGLLDLTGGGLPAPHLREHLVSGIPIAVDFRTENGERVAVRYVDVEPGPTQP